MPRALITPGQLRQRPGTYSRLLEENGFEVVWPPLDANMTQPDVLLKNLQGIDAMLASTEPMTREIMAASPSLRVIARLGVGYDSVDVAAATDLGIAVTITPGAVDVSVAEHTLAMLLCLVRDLIHRDRLVREGRWLRQAMPRLTGKTFGIVGLGRIGKAVAPRAAGLGMKIIACDPCADTAFAAAHNVRLVSFEELLATADIVSLHSPCTPETADLINARTLAQMKPDAVLINTGRGGLVDEEALYHALRRGHLFGAALDVFKAEPPPTNHPLLSLKNVLVCTHMAGLDKQSEEDMSRMAAECAVELYRGGWPEGRVVNSQIRPGWSWRR